MSSEAPPSSSLVRVGLVTYGSILLAEMGDKTQLATMLLSARSAHPWFTFGAAAAALILTSLIGAWAGVWVARICPPRVLKLAAGVGFIGIGGIILWTTWQQRI